MSSASLEEYLPFPLQLIIIGFIGLCFGSFATMLLHRMPEGKSFGGRSQCAHCHHPLAWFDLIPLLSFITLRGCCRYCHRSISSSYPLTEFLNTLLFVLLAIRFHELPLLLFFLILASSYAAFLIALYDARTQQIPDILTLILALTALCYRIRLQIFFESAAIRDGFFGVLPPLLLFGALWVVSQGRWIGSGDIFLGAALGFFLGFEESILMLFLAYFIGGIAAAYLLFLRKIPRKTPLAFGPFLVGGAFIAFTTGEHIVRWYFSLGR